MYPTSASIRRLCAILAVAACISPALAAPVSSAITYQGELQSGGVPVNGTVDIRVTLFDAATDGSSFGPPLVRTGVSVVGGRFTLSDLDFGSSAFNQARWLHIEVRSPSDPGNNAAFTTLSPRQPITAAPNAMLALSANTLGGLSSSFYTNAANLNNGVLQSARLAGTYSSPLTLNNAANILAGSGAGLTGLNASNLATGTVADARLSPNIFRLDATSTTITGGPLALNAPGSSAGGPAGFSEVVFAARTTNPGQHTAITIDGKPGQDAILYLAENGAPVWGLRSDSSEGKDLQIRLHDGGANTVMLTMDLNGSVGIGTPPVSGARLAVSGAIRTTDGFVFPDGSVMQSATGGFPRPTANYTFAAPPLVTWDGAACDLESDIEIGVEVIETELGSTRTIRVSPGRVAMSEARVSRRFVSTNTTWISAAAAVTSTTFNTSGRSLVISRSQGNPAGAVTFTFSDLVPVGHFIYRDSSGALREQLVLQTNSGLPAVPVFSGAALPAATMDRTSGLTLSVTGLAIPATSMDVASPARQISTSLQYIGTSRFPDVDIVRVPDYRLTVRSPFGGNTALRNWANDIIVAGLTTKRIIAVRSGTTTVFTSPGLGGFPCTYRIKRGTDGVLYEEYDFAIDGG